MMTMSIHYVLGYFYELNTILSSPSLFLTREFILFDTLYLIVTVFASIFFFGYRFNETKFYPILCSLLQGSYIVLSWSFCIWFCSNPISYIERKSSIWNNIDYNLNKTKLMNKYNCCGLTYSDTQNSTICQNQNIWSCSRAIINQEGSKLRSRAFNQFSFSFIHLAALVSIWATHLLGGIEYEDKLSNKPQSAQYEKV